jgi:thiol-disulfide isomerase/thioredoxin
MIPSNQNTRAGEGAVITGFGRRLALVTVLAAALAAAVALPSCTGADEEGMSADVSLETGAAASSAGAVAPVGFAKLADLNTQVAARRGRPVLLNFWATWCVPCVQELPDLAMLAREYEESGPDFIGISLDAWVTGRGEETEMKVRDALAAAGVTYTNLIYEGDQDPILSAFDLPGPIPYSILLDREGRSAFTWDTAVDIEEFREAVAALP